MMGTKAKKARDAVREGLESGIIAMDESQTMELMDSLRNFSTDGVDSFEAILAQDCLMVLKVFQEASRYNIGPDRTPVTSLSEAIQLIGVDRFRRLITRFYERSRGLNPTRKKILNESVNEAFVSGLFAEKLGEEIGMKNPSELLLPGQMQQLARVLIAQAMPFEFEKRSMLMNRVGRVEAERRVFGTTLCELSNELIQEQPLPPLVKASLREVIQVEKDGESFPNSGGRQAVLSMARETLELVSKTDLNWDTLEKGVAQLIPMMSREVPFTRGDFFRFVRSAHESLREFRMNRGSSMKEPSPLTERLEIISENRSTLFPPMQRSEILPLFKMDQAMAESEAQGGADHEVMSAISAAPEAAEEKQNGGKAGFQVASSIFSVFKDFAAMDVETMAEFLAWSHLKSFKLRNCLVFIPDDTGEELFLAHAEGQWLVDALPNVVIPAQERSIFSPSLRTGRDLLLSLPIPEKFLVHIPVWLKDKASEQSLGILPITSEKGIHGMLVCLGPELLETSAAPEILAESWTLRRMVSKAWNARNLQAIPLHDGHPVNL